MRFPNAHEELTVKFQIAVSGDGISNTFPTSNTIIIPETNNPSTDWHEIFTKMTMSTFDTLTVDQFNALTCRPQAWNQHITRGTRNLILKSRILKLLGVIRDPQAKIILQNGDVDFDVDNVVVATETDWYAAVNIPKVGLMPNGDFDIPVDSEFFELASGNSLSKTGIAFSQNTYNKTKNICWDFNIDPDL